MTNEKPKKRKQRKQKFIGPMPQPVVSQQPKPRSDAAGLTKNKTPKNALTIQRNHAKMSLHRQICSITDPFCTHAKGAKYPDGHGAGTVTYQIRSSIGLSTSAGGGGLNYFGATLPYSYIGYSSYAANAFTLGSGYGQLPGNTASFVAYADAYRVVSWGLVIRNNLPATTAAGQLIVSRQSSIPPPSSVVTEGALVGSAVEVHPICAGMEIAIIGRPLGTTSRAFTGQNTSSTTSDTWDVIKVEIFGAGTSVTSALSIEVLYNVEFTFKEANVGLHQFITPSIPTNPKVLTASEKVLSTSNTIFSKGLESASNSVLRLAANAVDDILSEGMLFLGL